MLGPFSLRLALAAGGGLGIVGGSLADSKSLALRPGRARGTNSLEFNGGVAGDRGTRTATTRSGGRLTGGRRHGRRDHLNGGGGSVERMEAERPS
jgi:hypothetical protein